MIFLSLQILLLLMLELLGFFCFWKIYLINDCFSGCATEGYGRFWKILILPITSVMILNYFVFRRLSGDVLSCRYLIVIIYLIIFLMNVDKWLMPNKWNSIASEFQRRLFDSIRLVVVVVTLFSSVFIIYEQYKLRCAQNLEFARQEARLYSVKKAAMKTQKELVELRKERDKMLLKIFKNRLRLMMIKEEAFYV